MLDKEELRSEMSNHLVILTPKVPYVCELSPVSLYFADGLVEWYHYRVSNKAGIKPGICNNEVYFYIPSSVNEFIDRQNNIFDIIQPTSSVFQKHKSLLLGDIHWFMRTIIAIGSTDMSRSGKQYRVTVGMGGLNFDKDGSLKKETTGKKTIDSIRCAAKRREFKEMLGSLLTFVWKCLVDIQELAARPKPAYSEERYTSYARILCKYLNIAEDMRFEIVTVIVSIIEGKERTEVKRHIDELNDREACYRKTGTLSFVMKDSSGIVYLFQVSAWCKGMITLTNDSISNTKLTVNRKL